MEPFDCAQMNDSSWIEFFVLNSNTCNYFIVCEEIINIDWIIIRSQQFLKPLNCLQTIAILNYVKTN